MKRIGKERTHGDLVVFGAIAGIERVPRMRLIERKGENRWRKRKWRIRHVCAEGSGAGEGRRKRKERTAMVRRDAAVEGHGVLRA